MEGAPYYDDDEDEENVAQDDGAAQRLAELLDTSEALLKRESTTLLNEIERLEMTRKMLDQRLGNVMGLVRLLSNGKLLLSDGC